MFSELWFIIVSTVLVNNLVLTQFLGLDPALTATRSLRPTLIHCSATSVVVLLAGIALWIMQAWLPDSDASHVLLLVAGVMIIAVIAAVVDRVVRELWPLQHRALGHHLPLLLSNSAILGAGLTLHAQTTSALQRAGYLIATMGAFTLVMILLAAARERLAGADLPTAFEGAAITVMTLGLVSLAFTGFAGMAGT